ncbi:hypothetical protein O181_106165 [Austropuccinia psidii MF-1]|uniref:Uncharacterized protein n=1 Tax=Austropuccinia psidii MF-1 TaxID=1389203 RepID=A0A9Q3PME8_9BASI|nr:hypothetical protein [Austropuccinia psidii MF-1]
MKPNFHQNESVIPQELIDPSLRFNQITITGATNKKKFKNLEKSQISFPSNFENIDPRILMEGISGENKLYPNMENIDPRLIREELDLTRVIESPRRGNKQNQVKDIPFWIEEEPLKMEFPCYKSTRKDMECSFSTVQNINEAKIDESRYENSTNSLSQLTIKQELNQQKTLHPQDKSSGEAYNNFNIEKEINSRFKKLKFIRNNATNEYIKNTIHSPNILEKHLSGSEYENEAGLFCQMEIQEEAEDEHKFILTEEEYPWEGYTNWQPLRNANLVEQNNDNPRNNCEVSNQHVKWLENISKPKKNESKKIKDKSSKKKKKTKEEKEYFWITQNKKICPSLQAHLARQYQISTQKEDWTENNNGNENIIQDYSNENVDFQDQYLNEERINELTAKKAKFKNGLDNKFSHYQ